MITQMRVPEVGESIQEVEIAKWLKQEDQWVEKDEEIVEIDSEKASLAIPTPVAGKIVKLLKRNGDKAEVGEVIAEIDDAAQPDQTQGQEQADVPQQDVPEQRPQDRTDPEPPEPTEPPKPATTTKTSEAADSAQPTTSPTKLTAVSPTEAQAASAKRMSLETQAATESQAQPKPSRAQQEKEADQQAARSSRTTHQSPSATAEEIVPMSMIRRRIAARLVEAQRNSALLTTFNEIDMSAVIQLRTELRQQFQEHYGIKLGFMSFFVKAVIEALKRYPEINAEVRGDDMVLHHHYDIGIAIGGGKGLVVPVLRDAEHLSFAEVEMAIEDFAKRAVSKKLQPDELAGGTFTISNGGVYGSLLSTPIVNPPQSGVLGMHAIQERPVAREGIVVIRPMMYVALTYDHRIVDGREAVGFLHRIKDLVEQPSRILLEV
jgi:2-oxoglutarate dehydrogenase E2 component (dihydrolipoamide succinyltransferase)